MCKENLKSLQSYEGVRGGHKPFVNLQWVDFATYLFLCYRNGDVPDNLIQDEDLIIFWNKVDNFEIGLKTWSVLVWGAVLGGL